MKLCDQCQKPLKGGISIGAATVCRDCEPDLVEAITAKRAAGKPVNAKQIARKIYKETCSGGNYLIRDIPQDLFGRMKVRAVEEGGSIRDLILTAVINYLEG